VNQKFAFFSLKWKLATAFGTVFLLLHSIFSYISYLEANKKFDLDHKALRTGHIHVANALLEDSFQGLEQFAEFLSLNEEFLSDKKSPLDAQWATWHSSWDLENITFFDKNGQPVKFWGSQFSDNADSAVLKVLNTSKSEQQVFCLEHCFQQVIVPVNDRLSSKGAFRIIRSLDNVILKYKHATNSDLGLLFAKPSAGAETNSLMAYQLLEISAPEKNRKVFDYLVKKYSVEQLLAENITIKLADGVFDVGVSNIKSSQANQVLFLLIEDLRVDYDNLNKELKKVWIYGVISFLASLFLLVAILHLALRRVSKLSQAIPMLSDHQYDSFRQRIKAPEINSLDNDELDQLTLSALTLANQLENLELNMRRNTFMLFEKSQDLAKERDFIQQLVDFAPIIIITQKVDGIILSINKAGVAAFALDNADIVGQVFDVFLPDYDHEHLVKLNQLRRGNVVQHVHASSFLVTDSKLIPFISWQHTLLTPQAEGSELIILSLGMDISDRKVADEYTLKVASYDYLTGLTSRRKFHDELLVELSAANRYGYQVALFYLDLDQFKSIANLSGSDAGDLLLLRAAISLKKALRESDMLSRIGGTEFVIIMSHFELATIDDIAKKILHTLATLEFSFDGQPYNITASIGISIYPLHGQTINELLANSNMALVEAKASGLGQYRVFSVDCDYQLKLSQMAYWRDVLEQAIEQNRFVIFYQPIVHITRNLLDCYKCSLCLRMPDDQYIPAAEFLSFAEELGLMGKIDRLFLRTAMKKLLQFDKEGKTQKLFVNLSSYSLSDNSFMADFISLLDTVKISPSKLIFEITEAAAVANLTMAELVIQQLHTLGCSVALDKFGIGFSSFYYLKKLPVDYVKIDGSFVKDLESNDDDRLFVQSIVGVAKAFNRVTVAENVETAAILDRLKALGIDYAQGDLLGKATLPD
jgi:diguanylate cyclase (GGDEF)-like protein